MNPARLFRTTAFRLSLLYAALFGALALVLLAFIYVSISHSNNKRMDATIALEMDGLRDRYKDAGLEGLLASIAKRSTPGAVTGRLYLLARPDYAPLGGNLSRWPAALEKSGAAWADFTLPPSDLVHLDDDYAEARAFVTVLPNGYHLLVGRNLHGREELLEDMLATFFWALGITLGLALAGGVLMSHSVLRRIDAINRTSRQIMSGNLKQRMPVQGSSDEFDQLTQNLNAMLDQIEHLMEGMRQVTDNVAHDLRSPLTRIRNRLDVTLLEPRNEREYRAAIEQSLTDIESLLKTFNALLSIAQAESGSRREDWEKIDLGALTEDLVDLYTPLAEDRGLSLGREISSGAVIAGNRHLLAQALGNLLDNAIKYTPSGGRIKVRVGAHEDGYEVQVNDTGPGIPPQARARVLERFVRLESSRSTPGNGLELSLVNAVAQYHHARLELGDNAPGLVASLRFPRAA